MEALPVFLDSGIPRNDAEIINLEFEMQYYC